MEVCHKSESILSFYISGDASGTQPCIGGIRSRVVQYDYSNVVIEWCIMYLTYNVGNFLCYGIWQETVYMIVCLIGVLEDNQVWLINIIMVELWWEEFPKRDVIFVNYDYCNF